MRVRTVLAAAVMLGAITAPVRADDRPLQVQIVDAMEQAFGVHPGFRSNHAKGIVTEGSFTAAPSAKSLSKAAIFSGATIPVTVRFSASTGIPDLPDGAEAANPHGMSLKFRLPDGRVTDMVINSLKFFPVATGEEFRDLFVAIAASPPNSLPPTPLDKFAATHPTVAASAATIATPDSYAHEAYFGIDAFVLVAASGERQAVRYEVLPDEGVVHIPPAEAAERKPDFLTTDLIDRLKRGPISFHFKAQLATAGDSTSDPSKPWPESRTVVDLGVLTIASVVPNSDEVQKRLLFLPTNLIDGIEASDDPLINLRGSAYPVSFSRRFR